MAKMINPSPSMLTLWGMLKSGKSVNFDTIVEKVGQKRNSVMVLICTMRFDFGAEIETEREGRKVKSYKLLNPQAVAPRMVAKATAAKAPKAAKVAIKQTKTVVARKAKSVKAAAPDAEDSLVNDYSIEEVSDAELADLKNQLGIA